MMNKFAFIVVFFCMYNAKTTFGYMPQIIAHRGASGYLPEHTLEAKVAAFFMHSDYLEQDLVLTKDNVPIVLHDIHLDEVTNVADVYPSRKRPDSRYYAIDFTFDEIKQLKVSERFPYNNKSNPFYPNRFPLWKSQFRLSSLEEEIELVQGLQGSMKRIYQLNGNKNLENLNSKAGIYVEIKEPEFHKKENKPNFSEIVLAILDKYGYKTKTDQVIIQCFDPYELRRIRNELKSNLILVQLLEANQILNNFDWTSVQGLAEISKYADGIGPEKSQLIDYDPKSKTIRPSALYKEAKRLKLFMHPYTFRVDSLPEYASTYSDLLKIFLDDLKIEGLFTDFPDITLSYIKSGSELAKFNRVLGFFCCIFSVFFIKIKF